MTCFEFKYIVSFFVLNKCISRKLYCDNIEEFLFGYFI